MFIGMGSITNATLANIGAYVGKTVSMLTPTMSIARAKFATAADPLIIEIVKADGSSYLPAVTKTVPLADIRAMWEFGVEQPPSTQVVADGGTAVQASAFPGWVLPVGGIALGVLLLWQSGALAFLGIGGKTGKRKSRRSGSRRSKR